MQTSFTGPFSPSISAEQLSGRAVHLWCVRTAAGAEVTSRFELLLSPEEKRRAASFGSEGLRQAFVVARGALRSILGFYLQRPPGSVLFAYGEQGKPALNPASPIQFNASHTGSVALFAFSLGCAVGIDVERVRQVEDLEEIAARFFCGAEVDELLALPEQQRADAFFRCWTRKEAYIKATGQGCSAKLNSFQVSLGEADAPRLIHLDGSRRAAQEWTLHHLDLAECAPGHMAALAYRDAERSLTMLRARNADDVLRL